MLTFNAIDVETANEDRASICQIAIVAVVGGRLRRDWCTLVDPRVPFAPMNIAIHGIRQTDVKGQPTLAQVWSDLSKRLRGSYVVSHSPFDRQSLEGAADRHRLPDLDVMWVDSVKIAKYAWPEYGSWGLKSVARELGISFRHHDALEDARVAAEAVIRASEETGFDIEDWWARFGQPGNPETVGDLMRRNVNPNGVLRGQKVVFAGSLKTPRRVAGDMAADAGMVVVRTVTRSTTMLVIGSSGGNGSAEHESALELIRQGVEIEIVTESQFRELVS